MITGSIGSPETIEYEKSIDESDCNLQNLSSLVILKLGKTIFSSIKDSLFSDSFSLIFSAFKEKLGKISNKTVTKANTANLFSINIPPYKFILKINIYKSCYTNIF